MLRTARTGPTAASMAAEMVAFVGDVVPLVTAKALTFTAQSAQKAIVAAMPRVFQSPTRFTLNSTRIEPATPEKLIARVAVKDRAAAGTTVAQNVLLPGVEGGRRGEKRFERSLRFSGLMVQGEYAVPGAAATLDGAGNLSAAAIRTVLKQLQGEVRGAKGAKRRRLAKRKNDLFVGTPAGRGNRPAGVYRREGGGREGQRRLRPLLIFVRKQPTYRARLDFTDLAATTARADFPAIQRRLLAKAAATRKAAFA
jgi:hypothetical protein